MIATVMRQVKTREFAGIALRLSSVGLILLINIVLARSLGPDDFGIYTYITSWLLMLGLMQRSGLSQLMVREVSTYLQTGQADLLTGVIRRGWQFTLGTSVILIAVTVAVVEALVLAGRSVDLRLAYVGLPIILFLAVTGQLEAVTRGAGWGVIGQAGEFVVRHASHLLIFAAFVLMPLPAVVSPFGAIVSAVAGAALAMVFAVIVYRKARSAHQIAAPQFEDRKWASSLLYLTGSTGLSAINGYVAILLAGLWLPPSEIANLQIATQLTVMVTLGLAVINLLQAADFARYFAAGDKHKIQELAVRGCRWSLAFALAVVAGIAVVGLPLIKLLFGDAYAGAYLPALIMMVGQLFNAATGAVSTILNSANLERYVLWSVLLSTICLVVLVVLLTPSFGSGGAAAAIAVGLIVWKGVSCWLLYRQTRIASWPIGVGSQSAA